LNVNDGGETKRSGLVLTSRLTGMFVTPFEAPATLTSTLPTQVVVMEGKDDTLIETVIGVGVTPFVALACVGCTLNQFPPQLDVDGLTVKVT
jgi:hypothetical protein